ncbi:hypothetical protein [Mycoplasmopsis pullorum]|uniref:Uncharacterized protein n=1 Tax=Mycoplasmopsis pullorum TaxID=48003 RepID=A0A1L4FSV1_9BACT|nr:hypothetical protein [Mycoplasmopsis pullorum]APJ38683.1 hypothetical protein BLA55_03415 [Mycoplasmopsis pullorum]
MSKETLLEKIESWEKRNQLKWAIQLILQSLQYDHYRNIRFSLAAEKYIDVVKDYLKKDNSKLTTKQVRQLVDEDKYLISKIAILCVNNTAKTLKVQALDKLAIAQILNLKDLDDCFEYEDQNAQLKICEEVLIKHFLTRFIEHFWLQCSLMSGK